MKKPPPFYWEIPECTNEEEYAIWEKLNKLKPAGINGFCTDCTPEYQAQMIEEGRCNRPFVVFEPDETGFIVGVVPLSEYVDD